VSAIFRIIIRSASKPRVGNARIIGQARCSVMPDAGLHHAREMLEFMIFAFTVVVGLLVILVFCWFGERSSTRKVREDIFLRQM